MKIRDCMKRNVFSIPASATLGEAAELLAAKHIGLLPVVNGRNQPVGVIGLRDLLTLALPAFVHLIEDVDFVHDFGAVESSQPVPGVLAQSVTTLMRPATTVKEECGLLRAYALMIQHKMHDMPVVEADGTLVGIASRVDIGTAIISGWKVTPSSSP